MAKRKQSTSQTTHATEELPVQLEPVEVIAKATIASRAFAEHDAILAELAEYAKGEKARAGKLYAEASEQLRHVREGSVLQLVRVEEVMDWKSNSVTVVRLDTGEVVRKRAMTPEERQGKLFDLDDPDAAAAE